MKRTEILIGLIIAFLIATLLNPKVSCNLDLRQAKQLQEEAVKMGHAKWTTDKNGNVRFEWLATQTAELRKEYN